MSIPINLDDFEQFLRNHGDSQSNIASVLRVVRKLSNGEGVETPNKPGETFLGGHFLRLSDDLAEIRRRGKEWLPCTGENPLDKSRGWAIAHPLQKLIKYKAFLSGEVVPPARKRAKRGHSAIPLSRQPLSRQVESIKTILGLDAALTLPQALQAANKMMGFDSNGSLPAQAELLLSKLM